MIFKHQTNGRPHPSGNPIRHARRGIPSHTHWPREDCVVPRLNHPRRELAGGFGFRIPEEPDDDMYLETWARDNDV